MAERLAFAVPSCSGVDAAQAVTVGWVEGEWIPQARRFWLSEHLKAVETCSVQFPLRNRRRKMLL